MAFAQLSDGGEAPSPSQDAGFLRLCWGPATKRPMVISSNTFVPDVRG
jgi:hypothetical protein